MKIIRADTEELKKAFVALDNVIYKDNIFYRKTDNDVLDILLAENSCFKLHATIIPCLAIDDDTVFARFILILDSHFKNYIQIAFFEALPNLINIASLIEKTAKNFFPETQQLIIGLNGHLNYGAGILLNQFNRVPLFGLNYNPEYYKNYFKDYKLTKLYSYRFESNADYKHSESFKERLLSKNISVRKFRKGNFRKEIEIYTYLNNLCFEKHLFWTKRTSDEDYELFKSFRFLIREENFLIAECEGLPIGFILWFPDFNEMIHSNRMMKADSYLHFDVLRYRIFNPIKTFRLAEIGVVPEFQRKGIDFLLLNEMMKYVRKRNYTFGEGGFILENNSESNLMAQRYIERLTRQQTLPFREYGLFIKEIN
ncbi:MAG: GNAT family N-acetyltransferase [Bacteroidales bacterium]|nr:GNAT family N-acetyltransferase [Bacteroidales bacterium]